MATVSRPPLPAPVGPGSEVLTLRLAVNFRPLVPTKIGGMEVYARRVVAELLRYDRAHIEGLTLFTSPQNHEVLPFPDPRVRKICIRDADPVPQMLSIMASDRADALFCPLISLEPRNAGIPSFVTIPDVQHEVYPEFFDVATLAILREVYPASARLASRVFTISEFSRQGLVQAYGLDPAHVVVVPLDADEAFREAYGAGEREEVRRRHGIPPRYVLYPAITWPHKNHRALLRAVQMFNQKREPLTVVLTGSEGPAHGAVRQEIAALGLAAHTRVLGHIPRRDLACLYRDALAMVCPSLFEGFGLPILESFHSGCPVVCSGTTSCPEIAGAAAAYIDPEDPATIAAALERLDVSCDERTRLVLAGRAQAARFSWHETGRQTFETIRAVVDEARRSVTLTEWPSITVVTPSLNQARFITETVESVLGQGYPNLEYIVVDGGSEDGTQGILARYGDRLRWISEPDRGQADAVNKGVALGGGEIIGWLNSDDTYAPGALAAVARAFLERPDVAVVYGRAEHVLEDGTLYGPYPTLPFDPERLAETCFVCQPATFMRRTAFDAVGGVNPDLRYCMDYDLWIRLGRAHRFAYLPQVLARSRLHDSAKTLASRRAVIEEIVRTVKRHYGVVPFEWVHKYADQLFNRSERHIFTTTRQSALAFGASLFLMLWFNRGRPSYWGPSARKAARRVFPHGGLLPASAFRGRWPDGWVSQRYATDVVAGPASRVIVIRGRHLMPGRRALMLSVRVDGASVGTHLLTDRGPFTLHVPCPPARDGGVRVELVASRTFRPIYWSSYRGSRDARPLACVIDDVAVL